MIIRRIRIRDFRKLGEQDLTFAPGLNVVRGRNDAGKSTLHLAFSAALFPIRPSEAKSYRPWGDAERGAGAVTLEFEADGRRYELRKDFASQKTALRSVPADRGPWAYGFDDMLARGEVRGRSQGCAQAKDAPAGGRGAAGGPAADGATMKLEPADSWALGLGREPEMCASQGRAGDIELGTETWETSKDIAARVGELLGFGSLALFRATAHIGQWQLAAVQDESREIGAHLSRIMTGTDSDAVRVLKTIAEWIRRQEVGLRGRPATAPGPLRRGQDRLSALADERQRLDAEVKEIEGAAVERERRAARIAQLEAAVVEDEALLAANRRLLDLDRRWDETGRRAGELAARLQRIDGTARDLAAAEADPALGLPEIPEDALAAVQQAEARAQVLRQQLTETEAARAGSAPARARPAQSRPGVDPRLLAALTGVAGLAGLVLLAAHHGAAGAIAFSLAAAAGVASAVVRARRAHRARLALFAERQRADQAEQAVASLRSLAGAAADDLGRGLAALGVGSIEDALARRTALRAARERRRAAAQLLEGLLGGQPRDAVAEAHRQAVLELGAVQAQREEHDLALRRLDAPAFQRLQIEAQHRRRALEEEKAAVQRLEGRLAGRSPHEALARVEEELAEIEARLARQQRQVAALRLTHDVLDRAHRATIMPGRARLEELASGYLKRLSGGAYDRIAVDEETLAPRVWLGGPKEWADVSEREIGSGGVDQCYLALRLGLADLLAEGRRPPLFLDDPFLAYDDERQASAMTFLRSLARDRQIFLFTCRTAYDRYADHVVVLGERAFSPDPAPTL